MAKNDYLKETADEYGTGQTKSGPPALGVEQWAAGGPCPAVGLWLPGGPRPPALQDKATDMKFSAGKQFESGFNPDLKP